MAMEDQQGGEAEGAGAPMGYRGVSSEKSLVSLPP